MPFCQFSRICGTVVPVLVPVIVPVPSDINVNKCDSFGPNINSTILKGLSHEIKWSFDDSTVYLGTFYLSGEGFKILKVSFLMLKCKKYSFRRFTPSPVLVLDKFPHGEKQVANPS
jgi:hypothetical protein